MAGHQVAHIAHLITTYFNKTPLTVKEIEANDSKLRREKGKNVHNKLNDQETDIQLKQSKKNQRYYIILGAKQQQLKNAALILSKGALGIRSSLTISRNYTRDLLEMTKYWKVRHFNEQMTETGEDIMQSTAQGALVCDYRVPGISVVDDLSYATISRDEDGHICINDLENKIEEAEMKSNEDKETSDSTRDIVIKPILKKRRIDNTIDSLANSKQGCRKSLLRKLHMVQKGNLCNQLLCQLVKEAAPKDASGTKKSFRRHVSVGTNPSGTGGKEVITTMSQNKIIVEQCGFDPVTVHFKQTLTSSGFLVGEITRLSSQSLQLSQRHKMLEWYNRQVTTQDRPSLLTLASISDNHPETVLSNVVQFWRTRFLASKPASVLNTVVESVNHRRLCHQLRRIVLKQIAHYQQKTATRRRNNFVASCSSLSPKYLGTLSFLVRSPVQVRWTHFRRQNIFSFKVYYGSCFVLQCVVRGTELAVVVDVSGNWLSCVSISRYEQCVSTPHFAHILKDTLLDHDQRANKTE